MPPIIKIQKEDIVKSGYELAIEKGLDGINARAIAKRLNCSIQPIFSNFKSMEDLKLEIINCAYETYSHYILGGSKQDKAYKEMGKAYIQFAKDYPNLFKILFMSDVKLNSNNYLTKDIVHPFILKHGTSATKLSEEQIQQFHFKMWIFTHGIATLIATDTCTFKEEEIDEMLKEIFYGLLNNTKEKKDETNN